MIEGLKQWITFNWTVSVRSKLDFYNLVFMNITTSVDTYGMVLCWPIFYGGRDMTKAQCDIKSKLRVLNYAKEIGNLLKACRYFWISRSLSCWCSVPLRVNDIFTLCHSKQHFLLRWSRMNLCLIPFPLGNDRYLSLFRSLGRVAFLNYTRCTRDPIHRWQIQNREVRIGEIP